MSLQMSLSATKTIGFLCKINCVEYILIFWAVLLESAKRNTSLALTLVALYATEHGQDPILVVTPEGNAAIDLEEFNLTMLNAI